MQPTDQTGHNRSKEINDARARINRAINTLLDEKTFFGTLTIHMMPPIADEDRQTIATDGRNLRYNPDWINEASREQIMFAIARISLAAGLAHHARRENRSYPRWQEASRQVTLPFMREHGFHTTEPGLNMPIEKAYELIPEPEKEPDPANNPAGAPDQTDQNSQQAPDGAEPQQPGTEQQPGQGQAQGQPQDTPEPAYDQGEVMDTPPKPTDDQEPGQSGNKSPQQSGDESPQQRGDNGDNRKGQESPSQSPNNQPESERNQRERQDEEIRWETRIKQAIQLSKAHGYQPGSIEELIRADEHTSVDWQTIAQRFAEDTADEQTSYNVPNMRFAASGPYLPGKKSETMKHICFAVDSSASMKTRELALIWAEIKAAADIIEPEYVRVIQCDAAIQDDQSYEVSDLPEDLMALGRRGTQYSPVFDLIEEGEQLPSCLFYMTDLDCNDFPDPPPSYPVLWMCTAPKNPREPPFGERVDIQHE